MRKVLLTFCVLFSCASLSFLTAQNIFSGFEYLFTPVRNYVVYQSAAEINIDGKANEPSWEYAAWTEEFIDIEGEKMPKPLHKTRVKMLWDNRYLYILAELDEQHVWSYYEKHDLIVFEENDFEVFIDPDDDTHNYFEIEINARNTIFDLFMAKPYRNGGIPIITWNAPGLKTAVFVDGAINNPTDTDKNWTVEMAIPFEALRLGVSTQIPKDNQVWRINFSRVQWQTEIADGIYKRKKDAVSGRIIPEDNWVWNPTGLINMHFPERWGMLQFTTNQVNGHKVAFQYPDFEELKKHLWLVYYKQKKYQGEKGRFAKTLSEINIPDTLTVGSGEKLELKLFASDFQFVAELISSNGIKITLNNDGLIQKNNR
jgi:hypothetical protein